MNSLRTYLNGRPVADQHDFASRCGTTLGYLRNAMSSGKKLGESLCIAIERESAGLVKCEAIRPDVDWAFLRGTECPPISSSKKRRRG